LRASDLGRLERALGPDLESATTSLEIRLDPSADIDEAAKAFLDGLRRRGARLVP
jgi:hypothetical protein